MNRRGFLGQALRVLALSPLLATTKVAKILVEPTIADKIRLEKPPAPEWVCNHDEGEICFCDPYPYSVQFQTKREEGGFLINFDVRDGILYLWQ